MVPFGIDSAITGHGATCRVLPVNNQLMRHAVKRDKQIEEDMIRKMIFATLVVGIAAVTATAQDKRVELSGTIGYTFSDGVSSANGGIRVPGVGTFDRIDPKDAMSWGVRLGYMVNDNSEVGILYNQQSTELDILGTSTVKLGDQSIHNYHGYYAYNAGDVDAKARPYFLIGLGATQYGSIKASNAGVSHDIGGNTKFSGTAGLGVKLFPSPKFGIRLEGRWTPTYIKSDASGWWCDPYWGCYVTSSAQYSNQFELSGGLIFRF